MRELDTIQKLEKLNNVFAVDEIGPGGANHSYIVTSNDDANKTLLEVNFQKGPRNDVNSIQGVLSVDLLEIVRDVLTSFQSGDYACRENALALTHVEEALLWLNKRTEDRYVRNVLGKYEK